MDLFNVLKNKRVLVTGHNGFKGSWLCKILSQYTKSIYGYSLPNYENSFLYNKLRITDLCENECFDDICNLNRLKQFVFSVKPDIVFHLAAQPLVRKSYKFPKCTFETNAIGTLNVLECFKDYQKECQIVCITTDKVYDNNENGIPFVETDKLGGHDPYSASKACAEIIIDSYRKSFYNVNSYGKTHFIQLASVRAGNVIGGGDFAEDRIIPDMVRSIMEKTSLQIRNPQSIRPWQHVIEPLYGYIMLACKMSQRMDDRYCSSFNFGPNEDSFKDVQHIVEFGFKQIGAGEYQIATNNQAKVHEAGILKLNNEKTRNVLGWKPKLDLTQTLDKTFIWYKAFLNNEDLIQLTERQIKEYDEYRQ